MSHGAVIRTAGHEQLWQMMQFFDDFKDNACLWWSLTVSFNSEVKSRLLFIKKKL